MKLFQLWLKLNLFFYLSILKIFIFEPLCLKIWWVFRTKLFWKHPKFVAMRLTIFTFPLDLDNDNKYFVWALHSYRLFSVKYWAQYFRFCLLVRPLVVVISVFVLIYCNVVDEDNFISFSVCSKFSWPTTTVYDLAT